jgi:hypothetical protein
MIYHTPCDEKSHLPEAGVSLVQEEVYACPTKAIAWSSCDD